ncbi:hypothetical protein NQU36_27070, partial [Escherichia coli]|uniref:hypothetical protein n=1 Tax=Escherichia coli TaxID=562 RepID=UPI0021174DA9
TIKPIIADEATDDDATDDDSTDDDNDTAGDDTDTTDDDETDTGATLTLETDGEPTVTTSGALKVVAAVKTKTGADGECKLKVAFP